MRLPKTHSSAPRERDRREAQTFLPSRGSSTSTPSSSKQPTSIDMGNLGSAMDRISDSSRRYWQSSPTGSLLSKLPVVCGGRGVWFVVACCVLFVTVSKLMEYMTYDAPMADSRVDVPDLDFTLENIVSASIGLSQLAAREIILVKNAHKEDTQVKGQTEEGVDEPVTVADSEANRVFINGFQTLFGEGSPNVKRLRKSGEEPGEIQLVSEEMEPKRKERIVPPLPSVTFKGGDKRLNKAETLIIVDPLDATKEFTEGVDKDGTDMLPWVTTLVCVTRNGEPIAGVVNRPFVKGEAVIWGVFTEDAKEIHPTSLMAEDSAAELSADTQKAAEAGHRVIVSRSHSGDVVDFLLDERGIKDGKVIPAGGAGYKAFAVLTGEADAYVHTTVIKIWDLCAGHALLSAAGGVVTDKVGQRLVYDKNAPKFTNGLVAVLDRDLLADYTQGLSAEGSAVASDELSEESDAQLNLADTGDASQKA